MCDKFPLTRGSLIRDKTARSSLIFITKELIYWEATNIYRRDWRYLTVWLPLYWLFPNLLPLAIVIYCSFEEIYGGNSLLLMGFNSFWPKPKSDTWFVPLNRSDSFFSFIAQSSEKIAKLNLDLHKSIKEPNFKAIGKLIKKSTPSNSVH